MGTSPAALPARQRFRKRLVAVLVAALLIPALYWLLRARPLANALYDEANREYEDGNYAVSLDIALRAKRVNPLSPKILALAAWDDFALGNLEEARRSFSRALWFEPWMEGARLGLAYTLVELGDGPEALKSFRRLSDRARNTTRAKVGMARAYILAGENGPALRILLDVLKSDPGNSFALRQFAALTGLNDPADASSLIPSTAKRPETVTVTAHIREGHFELPTARGWKKTYLAGIDIGPGQPGHFATEPPLDVGIYLEWLDGIRATGSNCVRVYTLLPPAFYRALFEHNREHAEAPIYLLQEIWLEDPPQGDLFDPKFSEDFQEQLRDVANAIHGRADIPIRLWHAGGIYTVDVSPYVIAWLVGREVEPRVVIATNSRHAGKTRFVGTYLRTEETSPSEVWLAQMCDYLVRYEVETYNSQRPVSFVNWPPLDPLNHPTETPLAEELKIRRGLGEQIAPLGSEVQDDVDVVSLDEEKIQAQPAFEAGYFACYHVYPFWPDFVFLDPQYRAASDDEGPSTYWGYLTDLKKHYKRTALLISEYGISTSLGVAHFTPGGMNHGGQSEAQQGEILVRLTKDILKAGCAGGILFEWVDEWWKHSWIGLDFEQPFDRHALWHNDMDPEQSFGIMKFSPQEPLAYATVANAGGAVVGDSGGASSTSPPLVIWIKTAADPSALYIDLVLDPSSARGPDWTRDRYVVALNTCGEPCGAEALPGVPGVRAAGGANFAVEIAGPNATRLLIAHNYNPYRTITVPARAPVTTIDIPRDMKTGLDPSAKFEDLVVETNRRRYGRDGAYFPSISYSRSLLRYGNFAEAGANYDSLGQFYFDDTTKVLRLRLSWGLLLVLDPTQGSIFRGTDGAGKPVGGKSRSILISALAYSAAAGRSADPAEILARTVEGNTIIEGWPVPWPDWRTFSFKTVPKQSYSVLAKSFTQLTGYSIPGGKR